VTLVLIAPLPYMEYVILADNPWQLPGFLNRSSLAGMAMVGATCQLTKMEKFSGNVRKHQRDTHGVNR